VVPGDQLERPQREVLRKRTRPSCVENAGALLRKWRARPGFKLALKLPVGIKIASVGARDSGLKANENKSGSGTRA
jgi:hypothetical protein